LALKDKADALLQGAASRRDVPGVVAAATTRDETIYEGAFGERVMGGSAAMTPDTVGWIASMTKAITAMAAMQLVEQGKLDLDSPARRWAPQLGEVAVLEGFDDAGQPLTRPPSPRCATC
jgi:CubicO group peptidase (beta-lactamase class C family)